MKATKFTLEAFKILSTGDPNQYWLMKCVLFKTNLDGVSLK